MSYCDNIKYRLLTTTKDEFSTMVDQLLAELPTNETIVRLVFFGTPVNNEQYIERRAILRDKLKHYFGRNIPSVSYVSQPPLNTPLLLEIHSFLPAKEDRFVYVSHNDYPYVLLENKTGRFLYAGGFQGDVIGSSVETQVANAFCQLKALLIKEGFPINSIVRQWNYIERITTYDDNNQHYQIFNNARAAFYRETDWPSGYPAATGIGTNLGGILIDADAVLLHNSSDMVKAIDNKLQVAAHAYSGQVLKNAENRKETPKFERAKGLTIEGKELIYVSGTAAIRGEESLCEVSIENQLRITMENIAELTGDAELKMLRVYLKHEDDFPMVKTFLQNAYPRLPIAYLWADVCRDELLIEIEGVAIRE